MKSMIGKRMIFVFFMIVYSITCRGMGPPWHEWWELMNLPPYDLYRNDTVIGQGYVESVMEQPPSLSTLPDLVLLVVFTNTIKGEVGRYEVMMPFDMRDANDYPSLYYLLDSEKRYKGRPKQPVALSIAQRLSNKKWEIHAIIPPEEWSDFGAQVEEGRIKHEEWVAAQKARRLEIDIHQLKLKDALELGDISQAEYDEKHKELEPLIEESQEIETKLWLDRSGHQYYDEVLGDEEE